MYKTVSVWRVKDGKSREAMAAIKTLVEYMTSKFDTKGEVYMQLFGPAGTIYTMGEFKDLATFQAAQAKVMADNGFWALAEKAAEVCDLPTIALLTPI